MLQMHVLIFHQEILADALKQISMALRHILLNGLIFIVMIILSTAQFTTNTTEINNKVFNVSRFKPLRYDVKIKFDVYNNVFFGECIIAIEIYRQTKTLIMNLETTAIIKVDLMDHYNNLTINIQKFSFINKTYIHLHLNQSSIEFLSPDKAEVLNYKGIKLIRAQELFPCWIKSKFKSIFNISIKHHQIYTFFSNVPMRKQVQSINNMLWTHFNESPSMSAKDLTIGITASTYSLISAKNLKFWHRKEIRDQVHFVKDITQKVIYYLQQKSTIKIRNVDCYIVKGLQHSYIRILNTVKSWGFILLREEDIIYNETLNQNVRKTEVANLIACATVSLWYDDAILWSREGFITFLAAHILDQTSTIHRMMDLFVVQIYGDSLRFDTLPIDSLPIDSLAHTANISTVHLFRSSFNYIKSFIIWRMLYHITSDDVFWTGIDTYINIQNTTYTNNLSTITPFWIAMESARNVTDNSNLNMKDVIDISMERLCPVVNVTQTTDFDFIHVTVLCANSSIYNKLFTDMKQYRLHMTYTTESVMNFDTSDNKSYFWLPIISNYTFNYTFGTIDWHGKNWIIFNLQQAGYYRVNYDLKNWENLGYYLYHINHTNIHVLNRAQIVDDAFYFLMQGQLNFNMFWHITSFLVKEIDYVAWYPMIKAVEHMTCVFPVKGIDRIKNTILNMFELLLRNIKYHDENDKNDFIKYLREEAVRWSCILGNLDCQKTATFELKKVLGSSVRNVRLLRKDWVYCNGLMGADNATWFEVFNKWSKTHDNTVLQYLICSQNYDIISNYILDILTDKFPVGIKKNERIYILFRIFAKHAKKDEILQYIFSYFNLFKLTPKKEISQIATLIVIITHEHSPNQLRKIRNFIISKSSFNEMLPVQDAVVQKIEKRKSEYSKQNTIYGQMEALNKRKRK
ncbi:thyrotropin-releasing hormone-degrading ectoenzyme-like isoform X3 [Linepithema humile]|uniref:thyrotropin-releasing hormone-degrading ectoenzyme-like isoform X3 n=1 Tax=Linepithema humile TaxID=83485 RepID=UPI00351EBA5A